MPIDPRGSTRARQIDKSSNRQIQQIFGSSLSLENGPCSLQVLPRVAFLLRAAEQVGGVKRRNQLRAAVDIDAAAETRDRLLRAEQRLGGECPERDDDLRL